MKQKIVKGAKKTGESVKTSDVVAKSTVPLEVPLRDNLTVGESIVLGFRMDMVSLREGDERVGGVLTGSGLGTDWIILEWHGRCACLRGSEILRAWVATFDPAAAERMR